MFLTDRLVVVRFGKIDGKIERKWGKISTHAWGMCVQLLLRVATVIISS